MAQILDDRAAVLLPLFHERELPRYLDLRAAYKQPISPALSHALRQQWLGSIDGPSLPLREAARALPLLLPDVMDGKALAQICSKVIMPVPALHVPSSLSCLVAWAVLILSEVTQAMVITPGVYKIGMHISASRRLSPCHSDARPCLLTIHSSSNVALSTSAAHVACYHSCAY